MCEIVRCTEWYFSHLLPLLSWCFSPPSQRDLLATDLRTYLLYLLGEQLAHVRRRDLSRSRGRVGGAPAHGPGEIYACTCACAHAMPMSMSMSMSMCMYVHVYIPSVVFTHVYVYVHTRMCMYTSGHRRHHHLHHRRVLRVVRRPAQHRVGCKADGAPLRLTLTLTLSLRLSLAHPN